MLGGWFRDNAGDEAQRERCRRPPRRSRGAGRRSSPLELDAAEAGRAAAYLITNAESAAFHLDRLRARAADFDPDTRDRFLAGALLPAAWAEPRPARAALVARAGARRVPLGRPPARAGDARVAAPPLGAKTLRARRPRAWRCARASGSLAQPFSCIGLPVATVPVFERGEAPIGVQIVAPPWREELCLRAAALLEVLGAAAAHPPETMAA